MYIKLFVNVCMTNHIRNIQGNLSSILFFPSGFGFDILLCRLNVQQACLILKNPNIM